LAGALHLFWRVRGYLTEGRHWLDRALAGSSRPSGARALAPGGAGPLARGRQGAAAARPLPDARLATDEQPEGASRLAWALHNLAWLVFRGGDAARAQALYERSLEIRRATGDLAGAPGSLINLGTLAADRGDFAAARALHEQGLGLARDLGDTGAEAWALQCLGDDGQAAEDLPAAASFYLAGLALFGQLGDLSGACNCLSGL